MEENVHSYRSPDSLRGRGQPITFIAHFMRQTQNMQHVDDVFLWLAQAMTYYLNIASVQFLAIQPDGAGRFHVEERAIARPNSSLSPAQMGYMNQQVTTVAERVFKEQRGIPSAPVENIFPPLQAALFTQHDLRCWAAYFLRNDAFLPPARSEHSSGKAMVPLNVIVSLFTRYPLSTDQARTIHFILEQATRITIDRGLLAVRASQETMARQRSEEDILQAYAHLVPRRAEDIEQYQAANPFANASIIADKNARRLYTAIDDKKNLGELAEITGLGSREMIVALQYLFEQQKVHFYTLQGDLVPRPAFISPLS